MAISTGFGVIVPQLNGNWVHEFADDRRSTSVRFVQDLRSDPTQFSFDTDAPDRNFFEVGAGVVLVLPHGYQAFANIRSIQGNDLIDSTAGSLGVRLEF
jgi:outer membrane autotransporter protein